jgi:type IV secretory pathway VirB2 component (pilin)
MLRKFLRENVGPPEPVQWAMRIAVFALVATLLFSPDPAHAQTLDPTTMVTAILTWLTGPFGKAAIAVVIGIVAFACMLGHHPYAALGAVVLGAMLLFGSQFFVTTFVG